MNYKHLNSGERHQIQALHSSGCNRRQIATQLARHPSSIGREIKRNTLPGSTGPYQAEQAQALACTRQSLCRNASTIKPRQWQLVETYLCLGLSPEQVTGRLLLEGGRPISHERIYQHIYADKARGGVLARHLRCQKVRRKRYGSGQERRGQLKNRVSIEQRPALVETRQDIGHWEGDTVIGAGQQGAMVTLVERKSRYTLACVLPNREAAPVSAAIIRMLRPHKQSCLSLTFDNGKEFADHVFFGACLQADVYFAHPYHSWERGTNENTNGLLRQYFPKRMSFMNLDDGEVDEAVYRLNHRPRKCLGYRTPHEVFFDLTLQPLH